MTDTEVVVIGAGLSGLVAAAEAADAGRRVTILDQEPAASIGGQAWWSFGGLFLVNSPEQRHLGIRDSAELALDDWLGSASFDRPEDHWPREWAKAYVDFAAGEKRSWLKQQGVSLFPIVQWAERGGYQVGGHGNSVPRFHLTWGTGPGVLVPFVRRVMEHVRTGRITLLFRHRVTQLTTFGRRVTGVAGEILVPSPVARGEESSRQVVGSFILSAGAVIVTSGGIGGNHELVRENWPGGFGAAPESMITGVPASTDGLMLGVAEKAGGRLINGDRMWHYPEGIINHSPVWPRHGIRILSGPSPLWLDAHGHRLPTPLFPGFDALGTVRHITSTGYPYSWFLTNMRTVGPEFGLSGSEQNGDLTGRSVRKLLAERAGGKIGPAVRAFLDNGVDFLTATTVPELVQKMNALTGNDLVDPVDLARTISLRDGQVRTGLGKDPQVVATAGARKYFGDRKMRTVEPHEILDPDAGPLVAVRLHILTRKSLGGLETDLSSAVLGSDGAGVVPGLYAAGEAAGFGGGGVHGYRALEGTFLGGCLFSGRTAGRSAAKLN
ncbi:FAD-binding dehydrogenase [Nakamurella sp. PAMC28650]|uniref:FAD-binding dehydrogenase n=1 Tax=Nakamurella sp. PAMC28650 TaxID=2762325 RepID=UPI00164D32FE|nr:FAD-binding dehydrogenase [Nakamurella sp. PAMC28650]QNK81747.1 FAD-binding dehydrogenase [Nakamurella sp. PAMC28650]